MADTNFPLTGFSSLAIHAGHKQDPNYAHLTPIYASSTFVYDDAEQGMRRFSGEEQGYIYSRWGNPTMSEAENKIASMESYGYDLELPKAYLQASGMAAITTLMLSTLKNRGCNTLTLFFIRRNVGYGQSIIARPGNTGIHCRLKRFEQGRRGTES